MVPGLCSFPLVAASAGGVDPLVRDIGFSLIVSGLLCVLDSAFAGAVDEIRIAMDDALAEMSRCQEVLR